MLAAEKHCSQGTPTTEAQELAPLESRTGNYKWIVCSVEIKARLSPVCKNYIFWCHNRSGIGTLIWRDLRGSQVVAICPWGTIFLRLPDDPSW